MTYILNGQEKKLESTLQDLPLIKKAFLQSVDISNRFLTENKSCSDFGLIKAQEGYLFMVLEDVRKIHGTGDCTWEKIVSGYFLPEKSSRVYKKEISSELVFSTAKGEKNSFELSCATLSYEPFLNGSQSVFQVGLSYKRCDRDICLSQLVILPDFFKK